MEDQSSKDRGEGIDGADRKVDAAGNDDEGRADGHDGRETGVFGEVCETLSVEEFVFLDSDEFPFSGGISAKDAFAFPLRVSFHFWHGDSAAKNREQGAKNKNHHNKAGFLKAK